MPRENKTKIFISNIDQVLSKLTRGTYHWPGDIISFSNFVIDTVSANSALINIYENVSNLKSIFCDKYGPQFLISNTK